MKKITKSSMKQQNGQIIVLLAVSLVVVMVVAALAVDGGMIYSERRFAQNAADASSLAGGGLLLNLDLDHFDFECPDNSSYDDTSKTFSDPTNVIAKTYKAANDVAMLNNINNLPFLGYYTNSEIEENLIDGELKDNDELTGDHGVIIICKEKTKPKSIDVKVKTTSSLSTAFAHLIYPGDLVTTNEAVTTVQLAGYKTWGNALVSLQPMEECNLSKPQDCGIKVFTTGSGKKSAITITNGGAFSNTVLYINNNLEDGALYAEGGFNTVHDEMTGFDISDWFNQFSGDHVKIESISVDNPVAYCKDLDVKDPIANKSMMPINKDTTLYEGNYNNGLRISGGEVHFEDGLYCIDGDIQITGGQLTGENVTFYVKGGSSVTITAVESFTLSANDFYGGTLFYFDGTGPDITFTGNGESYFSGIVYAPERVLVIKGNDDVKGTTYSSQFIAYRIEVGGSGKIDILYNGESTESEPGKMFLKK